jgi:uncharacterized protein (DUF1778 family)
MATRNPSKTKSTLMVRLDASGKSALLGASKLRQISVSDYVRQVTVTQARKEVESANDRILRLTPDEQLAFWTALSKTPPLTSAQKRLAAIMRGET